MIPVAEYFRGTQNPDFDQMATSFSGIFGWRKLALTLDANARVNKESFDAMVSELVASVGFIGFAERQLGDQLITVRNDRAEEIFAE